MLEPHHYFVAGRIESLEMSPMRMMACVICFPLCSGHDAHRDALLIAEYGNYDPFIHLYAVDKRR